MMLKRLTLLFSLCVLVVPANARLLHGGSGSGGQSFSPTWQDAGPGAGGYVVDTLFYPDGTEIVASDTNQEYNWNSSLGVWQLEFTALTLPAGDLTNPGSLAYNLIGDGYDVAACAYTNNSATSLVGSTSLRYGVYNQTVYKTSNAGANWTNTGQAVANAAKNESTNTQKLYGPNVWCDPQSSGQVAYVAGPNAAPLVTCNGGTSFASVSGITAPGTNIGAIIAGDPTSSVSSGIQQTVYIASQSTGIYVSTNGGTCSSGSFGLISGSPTGVITMWVDKYGSLWAITSSKIYKCSSSSCTLNHSYTAGGSGGSTFRGLAINPNSASQSVEQIVAVNDAGFIDITTNGGSAWSGMSSAQTVGGSGTTFSYSITDVPWLQSANQGAYIDTGKVAFDTSGNLFVSNGLGLYYLKPALSATSPLTYFSQSKGIEQLVTNRIISPFGVYPSYAGWDRGIFGQLNPNILPSSQYTNAAGIVAGWDENWDLKTPSALAAIVNSNIGDGEFSALSKTGGATFTAFSAFPDGTSQIGGMIAVNNAQIIDVPGQGIAPHCATNDASLSWSLISFPGSPANNWLNNYYLKRFVIASDRVTAGVFYAYDGGGVGLFSSSGGCAGTWTKVFSGYIDGSATYDGFNATLEAAPNSAGELFYTGGDVGGTQPQAEPFKHSTNGGATWATITNVEEVYNFGFGAPKPGSSTPFTLFFTGFYNSSYGNYYSTNDFSTAPVAATGSPWPFNFVGGPAATTGDNNVPGRMYVGWAQGGMAYIDLPWACPSVAFSNTNPGASLTGTVTLQATQSGLVPVQSVSFFVDGILIGTQIGGSGSPVTYSQSWVTGGVSTGSHVLSVATADNAGNSCTVNSFNGTILGNSGTVNSGAAPTVGQQLSFPGLSGAPPVVISVSGSSFTTAGQSQSLSSVAMVGANAMFSIPVTTH